MKDVEQTYLNNIFNNNNASCGINIGVLPSEIKNVKI
jgi:hypothetical protein